MGLEPGPQNLCSPALPLEPHPIPYFTRPVGEGGGGVVAEWSKARPVRENKRKPENPRFAPGPRQSLMFQGPVSRPIVNSCNYHSARRIAPSENLPKLSIPMAMKTDIRENWRPWL